MRTKTFCFCLMMALFVFLLPLNFALAQDAGANIPSPEKISFAGLGFGFSSNVTGKVIGTSFIGLPFPGLKGVHSITAVEVSAADEGSSQRFMLAGKPVAYQFREFIAYKLPFSLFNDRLTIHGMGGGGFTAVQTNVLGSFAGGGLFKWKFNDKVGAFFGPLVDYNSMKERSFLPWGGITLNLAAFQKK